MGIKSGLSLRQTIPLQKRKILKANIRGILSVLAVWTLLTAVVIWMISAGILKGPENAYDLASIWARWIALLGVAIVWKLAYPILYFFTYTYDIEGDNLTISKGVFAKHEITLPFSRITDVYIDRDVLDVVFGLCDLHISTPTAESGRAAHIDGLNTKGAAKLRALILFKINQSSYAVNQGVASSAGTTPDAATTQAMSR